MLETQLSAATRFLRTGIRTWLVAVLIMAAIVSTAAANPETWRYVWSRTDFSKHSIDYSEIFSGGVRKDGIPAIDDPKFVPIGQVSGLAETEPVVGVTVNGVSRAYPLRILMYHEIANDTLGGVPITVTYCPLCNSSIVFDRRLDGRVFDFGTTGNLRNSDLVMYDRQTESWWQQFLGEAIVGEMTGKTLTMLPSRLESVARFRARAPKGTVQVPTNARIRPYGRNPYAYYDSKSRPMLYRGDFPDGIEPMVRVVAIGDEAWSLPLLRDKGTITQGDIVIRWVAGQNSALDTRLIAEGRDVGNIVVQRRQGDTLEDVTHDVTFAFVFHAFRPDGVIHK
ncbi:MAG: DUF3179 domain-containing protein [Rhodospirillales bacterium]|jgi:hypothetical protein|nr:DUF3179 domain-containing protein [Rhodospirillales bacterium]